MFPGYFGIIRYGHFFFPAAALGFAVLLDAFLVVNFYWTALITPGQRNILLLLLAGTWGGLTAATSLFGRNLDLRAAPEKNDETFRQTMTHYLRGDWFAAESQILPYLKKYPKDAEMLLLQATMYRHTERYEEAQIALNRLQLLESSRYWTAEIESEKKIIEAAKKTADSV